MSKQRLFTIPRAGSRVILPDGRTGVLQKWPQITEGGLVKVNLDNGRCYVCVLSDLRLIEPEEPQFTHIFGAENRRNAPHYAEFEPE